MLRERVCPGLGMRGSEARGRRGLAVMATQKRPKLSHRGKRTNPENKETVSAPIRAASPLVEQYYVAVDRQLKSGYGTYEAAEKAARAIKERHPNPQVTVFNSKEQSHTAIEKPTVSPSKK
jgi:hypothetical protein